MRHASCPLALVIGLAISFTAPPLLAQADADRATARALGQDGEQALEAKDYKKAEDDFRRADALIHAPTLMLGLARALAGEGHLVEAQEAYQRILREGVAPGAPGAFARALEAAKKEVRDIAPKLGSLTIAVKAAAGGDVPNPNVTLDDAPVSAASLGVRRVANPGTHVVRASADGYKSTQVDVTVVAGGNADAPLTLERDLTAPAGSTPVATGATSAANTPPTAEQPGQPRTAGHSVLPWVMFGVGAVGLGAGVVGGVLALGKHSDLAKSCAGGCGPDQQSELSSYHTLGLISTIGFITAGVGAAAGVTLLLLQPKAYEGAPAVSFVVGPGNVGAYGRF